MYLIKYFSSTDMIYIAGGFNGQECLNTAEYYDPTTNQWTQLTNMRNRRSGVGITAYNGCIYVLGGFNGVSRMASGERYDPHTGSWSPVPEMTSPRSNFALGVRCVYWPSNTHVLYWINPSLLRCRSSLDLILFFFPFKCYEQSFLSVTSIDMTKNAPYIFANQSALHVLWTYFLPKLHSEFGIHVYLVQSFGIFQAVFGQSNQKHPVAIRTVTKLTSFFAFVLSRSRIKQKIKS